jgi:hypothetical protein
MSNMHTATAEEEEEEGDRTEGKRRRTTIHQIQYIILLKQFGVILAHDFVNDHGLRGPLQGWKPATTAAATAANVIAAAAAILCFVFVMFAVIA